jgi:hypothetical protein
MRKILFSVVVMSSVVFAARAQSYKSTYTFQKNVYTVAALQVPYPEDVISDAVKEYMLSKGYKDTHYKDFMVFRSVPINPAGSTSDAYFNVSQKNRSEKDISTIVLLPVKNAQTLSPSTVEDSSSINNALVYLDSLRYNIHKYSIEKQIATQQKSVDKIKSKMLDLKNDSGSIAKKIRNYESDLEQNKVDQATQTQVINGLATGDQAALAKAHKKMDKLMDDQTDYEKKIRNYKSDLDKNTADRATEQSLYDKANQALDAVKQKLQKLK